MNAKQREPYFTQVDAEHTAYALGEQRGYQVMCSWCAYFEVYSDPEGSQFADVECTHPVQHVREVLAERAFEGSDCWGFKPHSTKARDTIIDEHRVSPQRLIELVNMTFEERAELRHKHYVALARKYPHDFSK